MPRDALDLLDRASPFALAALIYLARTYGPRWLRSEEMEAGQYNEEADDRKCNHHHDFEDECDKVCNNIGRRSPPPPV